MQVPPLKPGLPTSVTTDKAFVLRMLGYVVTGAAVELQLVAHLIYCLHLHARHVILHPKCIIINRAYITSYMYILDLIPRRPSLH